DAIARQQAAGAFAEISGGGLQFSQRQTQDLLRAETEALRRNVSRLLRCRSSAVVFSADRDQSEQLSAPTPAAIDELGDPVDKREKIPGEQTARPFDRSERRARVAGAERRPSAGLSRRLFHHNAGEALSFHRQAQ